MRRVSLKKSPVSMEEVRGIVSSMFSHLSAYELSYTDDEGDKILVDCDSELQEALEVSRQSGNVSLIRLDLVEIEKNLAKEETETAIDASFIELKEEEEKPQDKNVPLCHVCQVKEVRLLCYTCENFLLCDSCHFENILFRSHHNPSHIFHTYRPKAQNAKVEVRVEIVEEMNKEVVQEAKEEAEETKEEVIEETVEEAKEEVEEVKEEVVEESKQEDPLLGLPNPVGNLLRFFLGEPKDEEVEEEVEEEEVKEEVEEEVEEEAEEVPEARRVALEALLPMGFDPERVNAVLDFVENNVEAALEILVGDAC